MNKVYLLEDTADYYQTRLLGIYSTEAKAQAAKQKLLDEGESYGQHRHYPSEHELEISEHELEISEQELK